eukprot:361458-Rhodomonas_salina.1
MSRVQKGFQLQFVILYLLAFACPESGAKLCNKYFESRQLSLLGMNLDDDTVKEINNLKKAVRDESKDSCCGSKGKGPRGQPQINANSSANFCAHFGNRNRNGGGNRDNRDASKQDEKPRNSDN